MTQLIIMLTIAFIVLILRIKIKGLRLYLRFVIWLRDATKWKFLKHHCNLIVMLSINLETGVAKYRFRHVWINKYCDQMAFKKEQRKERKRNKLFHKAIIAANLASENNGGINVYVIDTGGIYRLFDSKGYQKWVNMNPGFEKKFPITDAKYTAHKKPKMSIGKNGSLIHT